jgi:small subunit ribosomal protein S20
MPVTKTAKRALRSSKVKFENNKITLTGLSIALKQIHKKPSIQNLKRVFSLVDKAAKKKVIHKNKASRIKSQAARMVKPSKKS